MGDFERMSDGGGLSAMIHELIENQAEEGEKDIWDHQSFAKSLFFSGR